MSNYNKQNNGDEVSREIFGIMIYVCVFDCHWGSNPSRGG